MIYSLQGVLIKHISLIKVINNKYYINDIKS